MGWKRVIDKKRWKVFEQLCGVFSHWCVTETGGCKACENRLECAHQEWDQMKAIEEKMCEPLRKDWKGYDGKKELRCFKWRIVSIAQELEWQRQSNEMENETDVCVWMNCGRWFLTISWQDETDDHGMWKTTWTIDSHGIIEVCRTTERWN